MMFPGLFGLSNRLPPEAQGQLQTLMGKFGQAFPQFQQFRDFYHQNMPQQFQGIGLGAMGQMPPMAQGTPQASAQPYQAQQPQTTQPAPMQPPQPQGQPFQQNPMWQGMRAFGEGMGQAMQGQRPQPFRGFGGGPDGRGGSGSGSFTL